MTGTDDDASENDEERERWIQAMPKVELHAHLNGCIRPSTLQDLAKERNVILSSLHHDPKDNTETTGGTMYNRRPRSLKDCFDIFAEIPKCVDNRASLKRIVLETLEDFQDSHVVYLELRSTPKKLNDLSKLQYCKLILDTLLEYERQEETRYRSEVQQRQSAPEIANTIKLPMMCRFIVAADRSSTIADAVEHVELAIDLRDSYPGHVVGVDLGGNPCKNHFRDFQPAFEKAKAAGFKVTIHCGEVPCDAEQQPMEYDEVVSILDFGPDRLGHALLLPPTLQSKLNELQIPVESCPTSNVLTCELHKHPNSSSDDGSLVEGLALHPQLPAWIRQQHPVSIGTDDPGIFDTSQTKELLLVHHTFGISPEELQNIVLQSMEFAFCNNETKELVKARIGSWKFVK